MSNVFVNKYLYLESVEKDFDTGITEEEWDKMSKDEKLDLMQDWRDELECDTSNHWPYKFDIIVEHIGETITDN